MLALSETASSPYSELGYKGRFTFGRRDSIFMALRISLIEKFAALTSCSDGEIARLLGMSRSTVQAYRTGRLEENLSAQQKHKLVSAAQTYRQQIYEAVAELEMFS